jgi:hypothetical protein
MSRPLTTTDGPLEHEVRARLSLRQRKLLDALHDVMVKDEAKQAKAEGRGTVKITEAHVMRLALDHLVDTHEGFAGLKKKVKR